MHIGTRWKFGFFKSKDNVEIVEAVKLCKEIMNLMDTGDEYESELAVEREIKLRLKQLLRLLNK